MIKLLHWWYEVVWLWNSCHHWRPLMRTQQHSEFAGHNVDCKLNYGETTMELTTSKNVCRRSFWHTLIIRHHRLSTTHCRQMWLHWHVFSLFTCGHYTPEYLDWNTCSWKVCISNEIRREIQKPLFKKFRKFCPVYNDVKKTDRVQSLPEICHINLESPMAHTQAEFVVLQ